MVLECNGDEVLAKKIQMDACGEGENKDGFFYAWVADAARSGTKVIPHRRIAREGLPEGMEVDTGVVGAMTIEHSMKNPEVHTMSGIKLLQKLSDDLCAQCLINHPDIFYGCDDNNNEVQKCLEKTRNLYTLSFACVQGQYTGKNAIISVTQVGDVSVLLDTGERTANHLTGTKLENRPYAREKIAGRDIRMDEVKLHLKKEAKRYSKEVLHQDVDDQFFYKLIYHGETDPSLFKGNEDEAIAFANILKVHLRDSIKESDQISEEVFNLMWKIGFTKYQKLYCQNNPDSDVAHGALDSNMYEAIPAHLLMYTRFLLKDVLSAPNASLIVYSDGFKLDEDNQKNSEDKNKVDFGLKGQGPYAEQTAIKITLKQ